MKHTLSALVLATSLTLAGCASVFTPLTPGMPVQEVIALIGQPAIQYPDHPVCLTGNLFIMCDDNNRSA